LVRHVLEADITQYAGIVDEDVYGAEGLDGGLDDLVAILDAVVVCDSLPASLFDLVDNGVGGLSAVSVASLDVCTRYTVASCRTFPDWPSPLNEPPRSFTTTFAPLEPKKSEYALPSPPPAPVTTTVCPS